MNSHPEEGTPRQVPAVATTEMPPGEVQRAAAQARREFLLARISDPKAKSAEVSKLIARELIMVVYKLVSARGSAHASAVRRACSREVKALGAIAKQVMETERLRHEDVLNLDGEKFQYVFDSIVELFVRAMREAGMPEEMRENAMTQVARLKAEAWPGIRAAMEKIGDKPPA